AKGEMAADTDVSQLAFEIIALLELANAESVLHSNYGAYQKAGRAILARLRALATDVSLLPPRPCAAARPRRGGRAPAARPAVDEPWAVSYTHLA
ncbi:TetR family transcriptional regulator C-terminal domain-containing protein, partial [Streptomyces sp. DT17]